MGGKAQSRKIDDDKRAIEAVIARQLASLSWSPAAPADWAGFAADFHPNAALYPAARPAAGRSVASFVQRMRDLADTELRMFQEDLLGTEIHVFGNVAVAVAACEMTENGREINRNIEMMLLVKNDGDGPEGGWRIVAQAWDKASDDNPVPAYLLGKTETS